MKAVLVRIGSISVQSPVLAGSPKFSLSRHDSISCMLSGEKNTLNSPRISLHLGVNRRKDTPIRRALSDGDLIRWENEISRGSMKLSESGSLSLPARIPEDENEQHLLEGDVNDSESLILKKKVFSKVDFAGILPDSRIPVEELGFSGDGFGKGKKSGGGNGGYHGSNSCYGSDPRNNMGDYYKQMIKSNPGDSLLLRNYGKYLQEVEGDVKRAEEYYGRAILASPGDAEVLSLYGKLLWDTHRDGERAKSYFDQAVYASPDDCMVLGSYAHFMWQTEEDEEAEINGKAEVPPAPAMAAVC